MKKINLAITGCMGRMGQQLIKTSKANKKFKLKKTYWFLMETSYTGNLVPQIEENIDLAIWKFPEEIPKLMKNAYENIKLLINKLV